MLHIPLLRKGVPYRSVDVQVARHYLTREPFVEISLANPGLIRRDLLDQSTPYRRLAELSAAELLAASERAAELFSHHTLPLGEAGQSAEEYVRQTSATTGLPYVLVRRNMAKIHSVLANMRHVLAGLTRNLDLRVLDEGFVDHSGQLLSYYPRGESLGVVLPNNSPGVHSLWTPAPALKMPLVLKPGSAEPWTPMRIIQAYIQAGVPAAAFSYYPCEHAGAAEILRLTGRGMLFGDASTTRAWAADPRVEIHGPSYSKLLLGPDAADEWENYLDVMVSSIAENSGRSCVNASGIWTPRHGREIARALAERLVTVQPRAADDPDAQLAPFVDPQVAARISAVIDDGLLEPGAEDVTAQLRGAPRLCQWQGATYLLPTIICCQSPSHPLANREFLFPFASVVEYDPPAVLQHIGPSLVVTAITRDDDLRRRLLISPYIGRLNFGPISTMQISWDQPHEGNLFDHLYARRAFQRTLATVA